MKDALYSETCDFKINIVIDVSLSASCVVRIFENLECELGLQNDSHV